MPRCHRAGRVRLVSILLAAGVVGGRAFGAPPPASTADILQELHSFREMGSVLYVAAHPDDENNRLLPYFARGRGWRTAYLSLTRGDGGQNLIGPELGAELGVIRTQELLAARRIDGARQFFTRARDFGFSKDSADTLRRWNRQEVLADIVRVIRKFRPDVVITRFSTVPGHTHGHHTASAILALEAFKLAGDPKAFPEQLAEGLTPWQPKRIFWNSFNWANFGPDTTPGVVRLDAGGFDPLLGESFGEIGARGRSMHKSQGEGRTGARGPAIETFQLLDGAPADRGLFDGIDTTWARVSGGADIGPLTDDIIGKFNPFDPAASVPALLALRSKLAALPTDPVVAEKRAQLDRALVDCLGLFVETVVPQAQAVPGETLKLRHTVIARTGFPVRWLGVRYPGLKGQAPGEAVNLSPNEEAHRDASPVLPADTLLSQPYWLREDGTENMFRVDDARLIGRPENPPAFPVEQIFEVGGQTLVVADEPVQVIADPVRGEIRRPLEVIPPVALHWVQNLELFAPGSTKPVTVELTAARAGAAGTVQLEAAAGWQVAPASREFHLVAPGDRAQFTFDLTAPAVAGTARITASASIDGVRYTSDHVEIRYGHIPVQLLQPPARLKAVSLEFAIRGRKVGYLPGAGDLVAESLARMGYAVTPLTTTDLTLARLRRFDAVVLGVRVFNTRGDLDPLMPALFAYAEQGGNVIVQYNTANGLRGTRFAPYDLKLSGDRVTNASAPVTLLAPGNAALTTPNRIDAADFDGWVQERARFVPRTWDSHFVPLLAMGDPGEPPLTGTLLVARFGKGYFVYTGLSFFHELPAGVPGAYRLFANLVSLGKMADPTRPH
jgi:LmbE family N-acetylglucosaminyl deacetylase